MSTEITTLSQLGELLASLPDGTTSDILAEDLEAGNFDSVHFESTGGTLDVHYTGPVREGYVSPFEHDRS